MTRLIQPCSASLLLLVSLHVGCLETYDPPPETYIELPVEGAFSTGKSVTVFFNEPINPSTLKLKVWPNSLNTEGEFPTSLQPEVPSCIPGSCGEKLTAKLADDAMSVDLNFEARGIGRPGETVIVEIERGLEDVAGNDTGVPQRHSMSFRLDDSVRVNLEDVEFDEGVYVLAGSISGELPITVNFNFVGEAKVTPEGFFAMAISEAKVISGASPSTSNPDELFFEDNPDAFATHITGFVFNTDTGERILVTDPVDINVKIGGITAFLQGVRLNGKVVKNQNTQKDRLESSLSYEELVLTVINTKVYPSNSVPLNGDLIEQSRVPDGTPTVCDPCGYILSEGTCSPPMGFPSSMDPVFDRSAFCE